MRDTIVAIATATGGGVGMVRLSGPQALAVAGRVFRPMNPAKSPETMPGYTGAFGRVCHGEQLLDEAVLFVYHAPHSYTGEDVAEFCCHGGEFVLSQVLAAVIAAGARPAEAGEYTRRALMNGRMTLTEAESVIDILAAQNTQSLRAALGAMEGALHREVLAAADTLTDCCAHISAWIDYPEEDVEEVSPPVLLARLNRVEATLFRLEHSWQQGQMVRQGIATAIIGSANVGKSTLFNKLCGQRLAIVEDTPGITRDRIFANCEWNGHEFLLVDTGGIEPKATEGILAHMREQAQIAIDTADCIIMVTDVRNGLTAADEDVAHMLRRSHKPIILAVNKCDKVGEAPMELYEFYNLGFDEVMPISSVHGHGTGDLLDAVCAHLDFSETVVEEDRIPVAIIGRPNVGKSSLTNRILGENRMIVANEAGTTRDAIDTPVDNAYGKFIFTDTAGLRKRSNITDGLERYMVVRALAAVERSRVALILVDATVGFTEQDSKVAGYAHEQGKACIIVVNKWDAVEGKETNTMELQRRGYAECFSFMGYAPIIFISAQTGYNVNKLMQLIRDVDAENGARVPTGVLNEMLARATARMQPPSDKGRRLKIYYLTQASTRPPTFVAFVNAKHLFHFSYQRYLINQIRENFGLEHTPIRLVVRERGSGEVGAKDV